jgi:excisionase family DNA binding protein
MYRGEHPSTAAIQRSSSPQFATKQGAMSAVTQERPRFLNVGQAAEYIGVSAASLRKWSNEGFVPVYRTPGGQRRYTQGDLNAFIRTMRQGA